MDFYEVIKKRRTTGEFLDKEVPFETIKESLTQEILHQLGTIIGVGNSLF